MHIIELHAPTSSTQKLKLMGRGEQFTYIPTHMDQYSLPINDVKNSIRISVSPKGLGITFGLRHAYINLLDILLFSLSTRGDHWPPTLFDPFTKDCLV